ncbi:hypothetical protein PSHT_00393, partial [Puccinia striiformis]
VSKTFNPPSGDLPTHVALDAPRRARSSSRQESSAGPSRKRSRRAIAGRGEPPTRTTSRAKPIEAEPIDPATNSPSKPTIRDSAPKRCPFEVSLPDFQQKRDLSSFEQHFGAPFRILLCYHVLFAIPFLIPYPSPTFFQSSPSSNMIPHTLVQKQFRFLNLYIYRALYLSSSTRPP